MFYCLSGQIQAAFVSIRGFKTLYNLTDLKHLNSSVLILWNMPLLNWLFKNGSLWFTTGYKIIWATAIL